MAPVRQTGSPSFAAGTQLWPVVFPITDVIDEFYGRRGVRMVSTQAVVLIVYGFAPVPLLHLVRAGIHRHVGADRALELREAAA